MVVELELLQGDLYLWGWQDGSLERVDVVDSKRLPEPMADDVAELFRPSFFSLQIDLILAMEEGVKLHKPIDTFVQAFHRVFKPFQEVINFRDEEVFLNRVVDHVWACPVDVEARVLDEVVVEETDEVAGMLELVGGDVVDLEGGEDYCQHGDDELCSFHYWAGLGLGGGW